MRIKCNAIFHPHCPLVSSRRRKLQIKMHGWVDETRHQNKKPENFLQTETLNLLVVRLANEQMHIKRIRNASTNFRKIEMKINIQRNWMLENASKSMAAEFPAYRNYFCWITLNNTKRILQTLQNWSSYFCHIVVTTPGKKRVESSNLKLGLLILLRKTT